MISENDYRQLAQTFPALATLSPKVADLVQGELAPDEPVRHVEAIAIKGVPGCACVTDRRVLVFWQMKLFFFFKFPAQQEFHLEQLREVQGAGAELRLRAEAEPGNEDAGWEENVLTFASESQQQAFVSMLS